MTKRRDIMKTLSAHAKEHDPGIAIEEAGIAIEEGSNHTKVTLGGKVSVILRHREVNEMTTKAIYEQLGVKP